MAAQTISIPLIDVESQHCSLIIEKGLQKVKGLLSHKVEINNHRAVITTEQPDEVIPEVIKVIRDLGYHVKTSRKNFPVTGMTCASCANSVGTMIKALPGVVEANVNFANNTAMVEYLSETVGPEQFKKSIQSIGYDLLIEEKEAGSDNLEAIQHARTKSLRQRCAWSIFFSIPLLIIGMFFMDIPYANYIMWALSSPVLLIFGRQFFINAWKQLKHRSANMDTLVAMSTGIAYIFSVFNTVYPEFWHRRGLHGHVYFEAAAVVITFILLGKLLEERAKDNTSSAIKKMMGLQPKTVTIVDNNGQQKLVPIAAVSVGDILLIRPGDKIPVDGTLIQGSSYVDESTLSGEPLAVLKEIGSTVFSGTINQKGSFQFKAQKVGADTVLAHIIRAVQEAQGSRAPVQKLVDRIAGIFVPVVIILSVLTLIAWIIFGGVNGLTQGLLAMVTVLVIACPCALGLATPTAIMVGVGRGAENGILIKDAESLERAYKIDSIILDKTGTITEGKPALTEIIWAAGANQEKAASILYSLELQSEHPLAEAVSHYFQLKNTPINDVENFESVTGKGVTAKYEDELFFVGSRKFLEDHGIEISSVLLEKAQGWLEQAQTVIWFGNQKTSLAAIAIADKIKTNSAAAVQRLQKMGITVYMVTGDNQQTAKAVANQIGILHYKAETLPNDKAAFIKVLQGQEHVVAMVGDGINDSQALALADVSIAMGKGTDIAMDVAKMTLISSDLNSIPKAIALSKKTVQVIRQNLFWAFIYNVIGIPLAAGLLYPVNGFLLNPMIAGAAMALSSVSVVSNSLRLKWGKL